MIKASNRVSIDKFPSYEGGYSDGENVDLIEMEIGTKIGNDYYYVRYFADTESYSNELVLAHIP